MDATSSLLTRRSLFGLLAGGAAAIALPELAAAQAQMPSAATIENQLMRAAPRARRPRVTIEQLKRDLAIRRLAPSIDIQAINFRTGSARIETGELWKVERIAVAVDRILNRNPDELLLIEGHTDAVGSRSSNQTLSDRRAWSLSASLQSGYGLPGYALETVGYGEDFLLVATQRAEWRNRRVTIRRITDFIAY
ncbi:MAG: OmpA family protein [Rhizobiaceae bacterium]|jgi:outer membrane protein OmpA-like peptidoglycan-associated protein|nr:OmpA family protein [Rhizobiaceae bacterium]